MSPYSIITPILIHLGDIMVKYMYQPIPMQEIENFGQTRSIPCLPMPWRLAMLDHHNWNTDYSGF